MRNDEPSAVAKGASILTIGQRIRNLKYRFCFMYFKGIIYLRGQGFKACLPLDGLPASGMDPVEMLNNFKELNP